jgi:integrase/recombinase XerD
MNTREARDDLRAAVADYLALRRALGFKLDDAERLLGDFVAYLNDNDVPTITSEAALAWATIPTAAQPSWWAKRLSVVRQFATYLHAFDPHVQVPPADVLPQGPKRAEPFIYSQADIVALLHAAGKLRPMIAATSTTLVGLLAVTGMRVGEVIGLDRSNLDHRRGLLTIRSSKFGKSRQLPLHPSTIEALRAYLRARDRHIREPRSSALLLSTAGTRLFYSNVHLTFQKLTRTAQIAPRSATCRPRLHDLRHTFAVNTLVGWQRAGLDIQPRLPWLSTYLGHIAPSSTYWYLTGTPELLAGAADRLEHGQQVRP